MKAALLPGTVLRRSFLKPHGISMNALAVGIRVPNNRITAIVHGKRAISPDTALRFSRFFGNSAEFWLSIQQAYDLWQWESQYGKTIEKEVIPLEQTRTFH